MAVKGIGGSKAYVITSRVDPQSTANYYAQLATSQKYKLWQEAQNIALQEYKQDKTAYQTEAEFYQSAMRQLNRDIEANRKNVSALKAKELTAEAAAENRRIREENLRGRARRAPGGRSGTKQRALPYVDPVEKQLALDLDRAEDNLARKRTYNDKIDRDIAKLKDQYGGQVTPVNAGQIETLESQKVSITPEESIAIESQRERLTKRRGMSDEDVRADLRQRAAAGQVSGTESTGYSFTKEREIQPEVSPQFAELIRSEEERLAQLEGQLAAMQAPERPQFDFLGRTREIAGGFERGPRRPGAVEQAIEEGGMVSRPVTMPTPQGLSPQRRAELEALGTDDAFLQSLGVEPELVPPQSLVEAPPVTSMEDVRRIEERAQMQRTPATELFDDAFGMEGTAVDQRVLADEDMSFDRMRQELELGRALQEEELRKAQELGREEALRARETFPQFEADVPTERTGLTAPLLRSPDLPEGGPLAAQIPAVGDRALEFDALGVDMPEAPKAPTVLPPTVKYRTERIRASKKMLANPPKFGDEKPEWAVLVEKLYNPKEGELEDLQNAWEQITISYSDNKDIMEKAHDYLLYIDRAADAATKAQ